jgi:hypothetical protein
MQNGLDTFLRPSQLLRSSSFAAVALACGGASLSCGVSSPDMGSGDEPGQVREAAQSYADGALFRENFENNDWTFSSHIVNQSYTTNGVDGRILRASYPPASNGSPRITKRYDFNSSDKALLAFDVKFHSEFEWVKGGKLHGLGGGNGTTGCDAIDPNGWSVRLMWRADGVPELYVYHQNRVNRCGDGKKAENFAFERGRWYRVEIFVDVNSSPTTADGLARLYVDGVKLVEVKDLVLSGNSSVKADQFLVSTFYGGDDSTWSPSKKTYAYFDNFTVYSSERVSGTRGTDCELRREGIYNKGADVCCDDLCGSCGGTGCSGFPGGSSNCCTGTISSASANCSSASAPCKY